MDAHSDHPETSNWSHRIAVVIVALFLAHSGKCVWGQTADVSPVGRHFQQTHDLTNRSQTFPPVTWRVVNAAFTSGCLVAWTSETFQHTDAARTQPADCELRLRLVSGNRPARWQVATARDATNAAQGKDQAVVTLVSDRRGQAEVELTVSLLSTNLRQLAAGSYQTTIVGTITAN